MDNHSITSSAVQQITWERLEGFVRREVQGFVQAILEEEVTELLGRGKSERRKAVDAAPVHIRHRAAQSAIDIASTLTGDGPTE